MRKEALRWIAAFAGSLLISLSVSITAMAYPGGSPAGYTGSPGDGQNCVNCHGGSSATVSGWITSNIPGSGYVSGTNYTITVTVSGTGKKGFEVSPQNASGTQLGVLIAGTSNHLVGGTKYVTQNSSGSTSSTVSWSFTWTAPAAGTGNVTFYGAFTVGKSNTKLSTLLVTESTAVPLSANATSTPGSVCLGGTAQLNVTASGGSGSYTYSWTSMPAGFTSNIQNPTVTPNQTTQYIAQVSDGTNVADASAVVEVILQATAAAGNDTACAYVTSQVAVSGTAANYSIVQWSTSGTGTFSAASSLSGLYFPSTTDKDGGNVTLTLTATPISPCSATSSDMRVIHFDGPIGISTMQEKIRLQITPNPTSGRFAVKAGASVTSVTVSDICGRVVLQRTVESHGEVSEMFDMTGSPKGIYFVAVRNGVESTVGKLVIE